jgi:hypothetical protein
MAPNKPVLITLMPSVGEETEREGKHTKESDHWFNRTSTSNRYVALPEEESEGQ